MEYRTSTQHQFKYRRSVVTVEHYKNLRENAYNILNDCMQTLKRNEHKIPIRSLLKQNLESARLEVNRLTALLNGSLHDMKKRKEEYDSALQCDVVTSPVLVTAMDNINHSIKAVNTNIESITILLEEVKYNIKPRRLTCSARLSLEELFIKKRKIFSLKRLLLSGHITEHACIREL